jgi:hypothetical protein
VRQLPHYWFGGRSTQSAGRIVETADTVILADPAGEGSGPGLLPRLRSGRVPRLPTSLAILVEPGAE